MLELKNITKIYENSLNKTVLKNLNLNFNQNGLVVILGPSGSGKSTLLNLIGGLDNDYMGDILINNYPLKKFKEKTLDQYRNHKIGFIFQSYALINHLSALENVMLTLKLNGIRRKKRIEIAKNTLLKVGIKEYLKKPTELSGGEQARVGIARAIVNNPDIILADEPTGSLDSNNSINIMEILKDISKDKLVIMVTHNEELAKTYGDRIIRINDGEVILDSNPITENINSKDEFKKTKMSFKDAIFLSFKNLTTKKGRTILISLATSIGITGIALILSLSNGINKFISDIEKDTIYSYPITILSETISSDDLLDINYNENKHDDDKVYINKSLDNLKKTALIKHNDLLSLKEYLEKNKIDNLVNYINYSYNIPLNIYRTDYQKIDLNDYLNKENIDNDYINDIFLEIPNNQEYLKNSFTLLEGKYPEKYNEMVIILNENNEIYDYTLNMLGSFKSDSFSYDEFLNLEYKLVLNSSFYVKENNIWIKNNREEYLKRIIDESETLKVVGIIKPKYDMGFDCNIGYLNELTNYINNKNMESLIYNEQIENKDVNVFTNVLFEKELDSSFENNLNTIGVSTELSEITIIPKDFESKEKIVSLIKEYNKNNDKIVYKDYFKTILDSLTQIINTITTILIVFVSISLVVSAIMIGIITYVSVLERKKEIGILRSIGASKKDISRIFNAETFIIGSISSFISITATLVLNFLINEIIYSFISIKNASFLTIKNALILFIISTLITMIGGFIPSKIASKKNPIDALKSE